MLDALYARTGKRVKTVVRADTVGLFLLATGPWLTRLPLNFLDGLPGAPLRPLPPGFGRCRYRAGFIARRSAEDLAPFRALEETVRETALERSERSPDQGVGCIVPFTGNFDPHLPLSRRRPGAQRTASRKGRDDR